jgi:1,2-diacylglycerol 3-alpha-glucosyltransferase
MKILHACLSNYYVDDMGYQENMLVRQNVKDGHDVLVIASTENLDPENHLHYLRPGEYEGTDGALIVRLPYRMFPKAIARKIRSYVGLRDRITAFAPDVIFFHGLASWDLQIVSDYAALHHVPLFADTHSDYNNSGRSDLSRNILHGIFYRRAVQKSLPTLEKVLCVSIDTMHFAKDIYGVPDDKLEFFPLGGKLAQQEEIDDARAHLISAHGLSENHKIFVQSGKFGPAKRLTNTLHSFAAVPDPDMVLFLAGQIDLSIKADVLPLIRSDTRVRLLGWQSPDELYRLLCAADVYVQPGSQSATMQQALCCGCAIVLDDVESHKPYLSNNGFLITGTQAFSNIFQYISDGSIDLEQMKAASQELAQDFLDYSKLALRYAPASPQSDNEITV